MNKAAPPYKAVHCSITLVYTTPPPYWVTRTVILIVLYSHQNRRECGVVKCLAKSVQQYGHHDAASALCSSMIAASRHLLSQHKSLLCAADPEIKSFFIDVC